MPHVIVKIWPGRTEDQKKQLAERITQSFKEVFNSSEDSISIAISEVQPDEWTEQVYKPEIVGHWEQLYKKPGYTL